MNEKDNLMNNIILSMKDYLSEEQIIRLKDNLGILMASYEVTLQRYEIVSQENNNIYVFEKFLKAKVVNGQLSEKTVRAYSYRMRDFFLKVNKPFAEIDTDDIRAYLASVSANPDGSLKKRTSMNNIYHIINSFYSWLMDNEYIIKNPMTKIEPYKVKNVVRKPFTEEEIALLRDACEDIRDLALIDFLNSSMARVGEVVGLNRDDISFDDKETIVFGKGDKERVAYFDGQTKLHLIQYLESRTDDNPALFVSKRTGERLQVRGIEALLKNLGEKSGVKDTHPHKFRRTGATRCIRSGVPIDVVQRMLGHTNISTTQIYVSSTESTVKHYYQQVYSD